MAQFELYARKGAGSAAVEAILAVCAAPHTLTDVPREPDGGMPAWFFNINPRGEVPTLRLPDDTLMTESAAMMMHVADCFPAAGLAPALGTTARATYMRWMVYLAATAYTSDLRMYYPHRFSTDDAHAPSIKAKAIFDLNRDFDLFAAGLGEGPFILGHTMSAADIYAAMLLSWSEDMPKLFVRLPRLKALYDAVSANPVIRTVWDRNEMP